jgi:hypothetical protein
VSLAPRAWLGCLVLTAATVSCTRRLPGPAECRALALTIAGVQAREELPTPRHVAQVDQLTRECLVTPFDRTMLRCVEETRHYASCRRELERRRRELKH